MLTADLWHLGPRSSRSRRFVRSGPLAEADCYPVAPGIARRSNSTAASSYMASMKRV